MHTSENVDSRDMKTNAESRLAVVDRSVAHQCWSKSSTTSRSTAPHTEKMRLKCNGTISICVPRGRTADFDNAFSQQSINARQKKKEGKSKGPTCSHESFNLESLKWSKMLLFDTLRTFPDAVAASKRNAEISQLSPVNLECQICPRDC